MKQEQRHKQIKGLIVGYREKDKVILEFKTKVNAGKFMNWLNEEGVLDNLDENHSHPEVRDKEVKLKSTADSSGDILCKCGHSEEAHIHYDWDGGKHLLNCWKCDCKKFAKRNKEVKKG